MAEGKKPVDKLGQSLKCRVCAETLPSFVQLENHYRTHPDSGQKPYVCGECGKQFGHRSNLNTHIKLHTGDRPYLCEFCGKQDSDIGNLFKHMKVHEADKLNFPSDQENQMATQPPVESNKIVLPAKFEVQVITI